jgi:hypothetical protein
MNRLVAAAALLLVAPPARADVGPFIPATKFAGTTVSRIEVADDLPDHVGVFVRSYGPPKFDTEYAFVPLTRGTAVEFAGRYHDRAELLVVPRSAAGAYPNAQALSEAVRAGRVAAAASRTFRSRETVPAWGPADVTLSYEVRAGAGGPEVARTSRNPLWQWYAAALALAAGIAAGGLWLARRLFRRAAPQSVSRPSSSDG